MACPKCGCKTTYHYDASDDHGMEDPRELERCAACGDIFNVEDHADEDEGDEAAPGVLGMDGGPKP